MPSENVSLLETISTTPPTRAQAILPLGNNGELSLANPSWEFLHNNFTKLELQKHCRELGLTKVYVTKDKLIDMILQKHQSSQLSVIGDESDSSGPNSRLITKIMDEIKEIKDKLNMKTMEVEQLNEMLKAANVTINKLSDRISTLEERVVRRDGDNPQTSASSPANTSTQTADGTLLLGDTHLCDVRQSDLGKDTYIRTIKGTNMDLMRCWVSEKLNWKPARCIVVCGMHDILDGDTPAVVLDHLGTLISELKIVNENMDIFVCQMVPSLKVDELEETISYYNCQLVEWSSTNGVSIIKCELPFKLGTGDVDDMCFYVNGENPGVFLNRFGVKRLLTTINNQCNNFNLCENWNEVKRMDDAFIGRPVNLSNSRRHQFHLNPFKQQVQKRNGSNRTFHDHLPSRTNRDRNQNYITGDKNSNFNHKRMYNGSQQNDVISQSHSGRDFRSNNVSIYEQRSNSNRGGCYNCGEYNHHQVNCRYDHRVKCNSCHNFGHKSRRCSLYER